MVAALLPVLVLWAAIFVFSGVAAGSNAYQIGRGYDVSHLWETRERAAAAVGFAVLAFLPDLWQGYWWLFPLSVVVGLGMEACQFGLRFDVRLNLRRGLARDYVGTDPQTAATDKAVRGRGLTGKQWAALKLAGVVVGLLVLVGLRGWVYLSQ